MSPSQDHDLSRNQVGRLIDLATQAPIVFVLITSLSSALRLQETLMKLVRHVDSIPLIHLPSDFGRI